MTETDKETRRRLAAEAEVIDLLRLRLEEHTPDRANQAKMASTLMVRIIYDTVRGDADAIIQFCDNHERALVLGFLAETLRDRETRRKRKI